MDPAIASRPFGQDFPGVIAGAVIDAENLYVLKCLATDRRQAVIQETGSVVNRNETLNCGMGLNRQMFQTADVIGDEGVQMLPELRFAGNHPKEQIGQLVRS